MNPFKVGDTVEYRGTPLAQVQAGARGTVQGILSDILPGEPYLNITWIKNGPTAVFWKGQADGGYPASLFVKVQPLVHFFNYTINGPELIGQIKMRGEWEVRKELHSALDGLIEQIKSNPQGPAMLPPAGDIIKPL